MREIEARRWAASTAVAGTVFIAAGAFWLSFTSLADLAARSGIGAGQAWAWPLIVDGIIVVATVAVVALAGQRSAWYPWALLVGGALVSVTANAIHAVVAADADVPRILAASVAAVPPVALLALTHLTVILTRTPEAKANAPAAAAFQAVAGEAMPALLPGDEDLGTRDEGSAAADRRTRGRALREEGWSTKRHAREFSEPLTSMGSW